MLHDLSATVSPAIGKQTKSSSKLPAAVVVIGVLLSLTPARAESVDVTFANITNATISVTATDLNDGNKVIVKDEKLKHNEQVTKKMVLKGSDGNVKYTAKGNDSGYTCKDKSYEGKQLSRGHTFGISLECTKK